MHGALNYRVMTIFCPEFKKMIKECETTVSKITIYYDKKKKKNEFSEDFSEISLVGFLGSSLS